MRPGAPEEVLRSGVSVGVVVDMVRGGRVLAAGVPVADASLEWSADRVVPGRLVFTAPREWLPEHPLAPLAWFGQRARVSVVVRLGEVEWATPLGEWLVTDWEDTGGGVQVTCLDLMQVLEEDPMPWPSSPPAGSSLSTEMRRLAGRMPVVLDAGVVDGPVSTSTQWGCSRSEAVVKLAQSRSCGIRSGHDGALHVYALRDASRVDATYEADDLGWRQGNGLLLSAPRAPRGQSRRPNRWVVTGTHTEGEREERWTATRTVTQPPYDPAGYGWVTRHEEFSAADSREAVEAAADTYMREDLSASVRRHLEIVPDPRLEVGDVVAAWTGEESLVGRVVAYSLPLSDVGGSMRVDVDVLDW